MEHLGFTKSEVDALIGRVFATISGLTDIPKGAQGIVISTDRDDRVWQVVIAWEIRSGQKLRSSHSKHEVQKYMREVTH